MSKALKRGNTVKCAFWNDNFAVEVTAVGDKQFLGYRIDYGEKSRHEEMFTIDPDPNKMMKKNKREWVLA